MTLNGSEIRGIRNGRKKEETKKRETIIIIIIENVLFVLVDWCVCK
jgi:hypothetical protein